MNNKIMMKMRVGNKRQYLLLSLALSFFLLFSISYAGDMSGIVKDATTREPLPGANIIIDGTKLGTATGLDGSFAIQNIADGKYKLNISLIGYKKISRSLIIAGQSNNQLEINLEPQPWELDAIVVTATRRNQILKDVPVTTELITREEMSQTGALTVADALESNIGANISDDLSGKGIPLRGIDPSRVLILIDGRRVIGRVLGSLDLGQISLSNVERIEIVKGSGSTLYGSDALGGVINIITQKPRELSSLRTSIEYGSFKTFDPEIQFEGKLNKWGLLLSGKHEQTDGFDLIKETPHTNGQEQIKRYNIDTKLTFDPQQSFQNTLTFGYMQERKQWIESEWFEEFNRHFVYDDYEWNSRYDVGLSSKYIVSPRTEMEASAHWSFYDHEWDKFTRVGVWIDTSLTRDDIIECSYQINHSLRSNIIATSGLDFARSSLESDQIEGGKQVVSYGDAYLQTEWMPHKKLSFLPGIRLEQHETYGTHINPSMNFKYSPSDMIAFRGTIGGGYRAPSIKELYFIFDHSAAGYIVYGGGEELNPEKSINYALTTELNYNRRGLHRLTLFRNDLSNLIEFGLIEFTPIYWRGVYRYQNIVKARTLGLEWESKLGICTGWDFSFAYTYMQAKNLTEDVKLINRPEHIFKFRSHFYVPKWTANLTVWGTYQDHKLWTSQGDTPERISDDYAPKRIVLNANLTKTIYRSLDAYFKVENIKGDVNATYGYWPPRQYTVGIKLNLSKRGI